jgi:tRNA dimethylallyltransferase
LRELLVITGPTASGKSRLAMDIAKEVPLEIISADSMQVYRYMDIGTDKPSMEDRRKVNHHLLDLKDPDEQWSVEEFQRSAQEAIDQIRARGNVPAIVGGTGFYIRALLHGFPLKDAPPNGEFRREMQDMAARLGNEAVHNLLKDKDPWSWEHLHPNDLKRVIRALEYHNAIGHPISARREAKPSRRYEYLMLGVQWERQDLYKRIDGRAQEQVQRGLIEEVKGLLQMGYSKELESMNGLCYKESCMYLEGLLTLDETKKLIARNTRRYAKRQMTWFAREEGIIWIRAGNDKLWKDTLDEALKLVRARCL